MRIGQSNKRALGDIFAAAVKGVQKKKNHTKVISLACSWLLKPELHSDNSPTNENEDVWSNVFSQILIFFFASGAKPYNRYYK